MGVFYKRLFFFTSIHVCCSKHLILIRIIDTYFFKNQKKSAHVFLKSYSNPGGCLPVVFLQRACCACDAESHRCPPPRYTMKTSSMFQPWRSKGPTPKVKDQTLCKFWYLVQLGLSPLPVIVEMKVYRDSLLKM